MSKISFTIVKRDKIKQSKTLQLHYNNNEIYSQANIKLLCLTYSVLQAVLSFLNNLFLNYLHDSFCAHKIITKIILKSERGVRKLKNKPNPRAIIGSRLNLVQITLIVSQIYNCIGTHIDRRVYWLMGMTILKRKGMNSAHCPQIIGWSLININDNFLSKTLITRAYIGIGFNDLWDWLKTLQA